jgi:hypothetical protein
MKKRAHFDPFQKIVLIGFTALALIGLLWIIRWVSIDKVGIPQALANDETLTLSMDNGDIIRGTRDEFGGLSRLVLEVWTFTGE